MNKHVNTYYANVYKWRFFTWILIAFLLCGFNKNTYAQCNITINNVEVSNCFYEEALGINRAFVDINVNWANVWDVINISTDNPSAYTVPIIAYNNATGNTIFTIAVPADGGTYTITATSGGNAACTTTAVYTAPNTCLPISCTPSDIGGQVFIDDNANGQRDAREYWGLENVTVNAFTNNGFVYTTTTNIDGDYVLSIPPDSLPVRVEFAHIPTQYQETSTASGADAATMVQFVTGASCNVNIGVNNQANYAQENGFLATPCYDYGDANDINNPNYNDPAFVSFGANWGATAANINTGELTEWQIPNAPQYLSEINEIGATWGVAWNRETEMLYTSAFMKNFAGFGPHGPGAIYQVPTNPVTGLPTGTPSLFVNLVDLGITMCNDPHGSEFPTADILHTSFDAVGKCSLGDLEISDDYSTLYTVNLTDASREVIAIDIATQSIVQTWPFPLNQTEPTNPDTDIRPFALAYHNGQLYVGATATAESDGNVGKQYAYVYTIDETQTGTAAYSLVFKHRFIDRRCCQGPWYPTWLDYRNTIRPAEEDLLENGVENWVIARSPWLTDIEFNGNYMILGIRDRMGDQFGRQIPDPYGANPNTIYLNGSSSGDLISAAWDGNKYVLEANGTSGKFAKPADANGMIIWWGNTETEFFWGDGYNDVYGTQDNNGHDEGTWGGLSLAGTNPLAHTALSPVDAFGVFVFETGGVGFVNTSTGAPERTYGLYQADNTNGLYGKANGLGDLEMLTVPPPIQIGNYVWFDVDGDGVQDPSEMPLENVLVELYDATGNFIASTNTNANGNYYFSSLNDNIVYDTDYILTFGNGQFDSNTGLDLGNGQRYMLTTANSGASASINPNQNDSDADPLVLSTSIGALPANLPLIAFRSGTAGENNHTFDVGFTLVEEAICTLNASASIGSCNNNNTPTNASDDTFAITLNVTATNGGESNQYTLTNGTNNWGPFDYDTDNQITGLTANGNTITLTISDVDDNTCQTTTQVSQNSCAVTCPPTQCLPVNVIINN